MEGALPSQSFCDAEICVRVTIAVIADPAYKAGSVDRSSDAGGSDGEGAVAAKYEDLLIMFGAA